MTILITGSSGFIGFSLANYLLKNNYKVLGIDNFDKYYSTALKKKRLRGTYNLGSRNGMSKAEFALKIANHLNLSTKNLNVITSDKLLNTVYLSSGCCA